MIVSYVGGVIVRTDMMTQEYNISNMAQTKIHSQDSMACIRTAHNGEAMHGILIVDKSLCLSTTSVG